MDDHPRLRPVDAFPIQQEGKTLIYFRDSQHFADVKEAKVDLVWEPPWDPSMMSAEARQKLGMG